MSTAHLMMVIVVDEAERDETVLSSSVTGSHVSERYSQMDFNTGHSTFKQGIQTATPQLCLDGMIWQLKWKLLGSVS